MTAEIKPGKATRGAVTRLSAVLWKIKELFILLFP